MVNAEFPADSPLGRIHEIKEMPKPHRLMLVFDG